MSSETKKRSANLDLRKEIGAYVIGTFEGRFESKNFPGKFSSLIRVEDTTGYTTIFNKETEKEEEMDIDKGDTVFLSESSWLANFLEKRVKGDKIRLEYTGKGKPKQKGYKAAYEYKCEVL